MQLENHLTKLNIIVHLKCGRNMAKINICFSSVTTGLQFIVIILSRMQYFSCESKPAVEVPGTGITVCD